MRCVYVNRTDTELQERGECMRRGGGGRGGGGSEREGGRWLEERRRGLDAEENNSGTCAGNTSIFSSSPLRAEQKHELNDFGRGERGVHECMRVFVFMCVWKGMGGGDGDG